MSKLQKKQQGTERHESPREDAFCVESIMAFARPCYVFPEAASPQGGKGKRLVLPNAPAPGKQPELWDVRRVRISDLAQRRGRLSSGFEPDIFTNGFAVADLSCLLHFQEIIQRITLKDELGARDAEDLAQALVGAPIPLGAGHSLEILNVDTKNLYMRKSGPDGMRIHTDGGSRRSSLASQASSRTLPPAVNVHTDGDVDSERRGPGFKRHFNHSGNPSSELFVLNLWIALQQPVRPLAVMDCKTLDRERDQVKQSFPLPPRADDPMEKFNPDEPAIAEVQTILYQPGQEWHFKSDLGLGQALTFDTASTPHGAFLMPGEEELGQLYRQLERATAVLTQGGLGADVSIGALTYALWPDSQESSPLCPKRPRAPERSLPVSRLIAEMEDLVQEGRRRAPRLCRGASEWERQTGRKTPRAEYLQRVASALGRSVRKSVEIRCSALVRPQEAGLLCSSTDFLSIFKLPPAWDKLGILDSLMDIRIPGSKVPGWVAFVLMYLTCAMLLIFPHSFGLGTVVA